MAVKLTRLTHKIAIQLQLVAKRYTICSSRSRRPVRKLLVTPSYLLPNLWWFPFSYKSWHLPRIKVRLFTVTSYLTDSLTN